MENTIICQSCAMPIDADEAKGTNKDGSLSHEYCTHCFQNGKFPQDYTMDEMIEICVQYLDEFNKDSEKKFTREEAIANMKQFFPTLKRWIKD